MVAAELLSEHKVLKGEYPRKFVHITAGTFIAFWPWLISWQAIRWIGVTMLLVVLINHRVRLFRFHSTLGRQTYGDIIYASAITLTALLTDEAIFFALAMLNLALADGLAAIAGKLYGGRWTYKIFGHTKSIIGTMTFWLTSLFILGVGALFAHDLIDFYPYVVLIIFLPPILALTENISVGGLDNLFIPLIVLYALNLAQAAS